MLQETHLLCWVELGCVPIAGSSEFMTQVHPFLNVAKTFGQLVSLVECALSSVVFFCVSDQVPDCKTIHVDSVKYGLVRVSEEGIVLDTFTKLVVAERVSVDCHRRRSHQGSIRQ